MIGILKFIVYFFFFYALYKIVGLILKALIRRWLASKMAAFERSGQNFQRQTTANEGEIHFHKKSSPQQNNKPSSAYDDEYIDFEEVK